MAKVIASRLQAGRDAVTCKYFLKNGWKSHNAPHLLVLSNIIL